MAKVQFHERKSTKLILVHCTATKPHQDIGVREVRQWHKHDNGWLDVGYHFIIRRNGVIEDGRPVNVVGAHASGFNSDSVGVCLVGGIDSKGEADANFTIEQYQSLKVLLDTLKDKYPEAQVKGHRDVNNGKECPSFDIHSLLTNQA